MVKFWVEGRSNVPVTSKKIATNIKRYAFVIIVKYYFLLNEGIVSKKDVFEKAKLFDSKGFFGMNSDVMTQEEFDNFLEKEERRNHH